MKRIEKYDVYSLPIAKVWADPAFNCRSEFAAHSVQELSQSIEQDGLHFPVVVQPASDCKLPAGYEYKLVAGFRRFYAISNFLKWSEVAANVRTGMTEHQARVLNLTENLERKDLNILEEARAIKRLYPKHFSLREISKEVKRDTRWVHIRLRLMEMPEEIQTKAASGVLSKSDLEVIAQQDTPENQIKCARDLEAAKKRGDKLKTGNRYGKRFRYQLTKAQISDLIARMFEMGLTGGIGPRVAARCAGYIDDADIDEDIRSEILKEKQSVCGLYTGEHAPG